MGERKKYYSELPPDLIELSHRSARSVIPTESEHQIICEYLRVHDERLYHCWSVMVALGMRLGDCLALRTDTVQKVCSNGDRSIRFQELKRVRQSLAVSHQLNIKLKPRVVELSGSVKDALLRAVAFAQAKRSPWLIPSLTSGGRYRGNPLLQVSASRLFKQRFDALRLDRPDSLSQGVKAHSARKLFASRALKRFGGDWVAVQQLLGHSSASVTKTYLVEPGGA